MDLNVLIIDDHPPIVEGYKSILSYNPNGYKLNVIAAYNCETAYSIITEKFKPVAFDIVLVDVTLPPFKEKNIESGEDIAVLVKEHLPETKIIMLTSHSESLVLYSILNKCQPDGLLVKSDFLPEEFLHAFDTVVKGENYYSITVRNLRNDMDSNVKTLDSYNRQIILLLSQGVKTKNFHEHIHLSTSAIEKRKVIIKDYLGILKGTDEDILREARKQGLI